MESKVKIPALQFTTNKEPFCKLEPNVRLDLIIKAKRILFKSDSVPNPSKPQPSTIKTKCLVLLLFYI